MLFGAVYHFLRLPGAREDGEGTDAGGRKVRSEEVKEADAVLARRLVS